MKVKKKHLTGEIADFPLYVVQAMVDEQVKQGNPANPRVFAEFVTADKARGGFDWNESEAGTNFWWQVIALKRFNLAPEPEQVHLISESENHTQTETTPEPAKPKRKIIQISECIASDDRYASPWNLSALCDDGTVWIRSDVNSDWVRLPDIPQDGE